MMQMTVDTQRATIAEQQATIAKLEQELAAVKTGRTVKQVMMLEAEKLSLQQRVATLVFKVSVAAQNPLLRGPGLIRSHDRANRESCIP